MYPETVSRVINITLPYVDGILEMAGHLSVAVRIANQFRDTGFVRKTVKIWLSDGTVTVSEDLRMLLTNNRTQETGQLHPEHGTGHDMSGSHRAWAR